MTLPSGFNVRPSHSRVDGCMEPSEVDRLDSRKDQERPGKAVDNDLLNALPTKVADSAKTGMSSDRLRVAVSLRAKVADRAGSDLRRWERSSRHRIISARRRKPSQNERIRPTSAAMLKKSASSRFSGGRNKPPPSWQPFPNPSI